MKRDKQRPRNGNFNWPNFRQRMTTLTSSTAPSDDAEMDQELDRLLSERARQLSRPVTDGELTDQLTVLVCTDGQNRYALEMSYIAELFALEKLTRVPNVPDFILGVTSRLGEIITVLDLSRFFGGPGIEQINYLMLLSIAGNRLAIGLPQIAEIGQLPRRQLQSLPPQLPAEFAQYLSGVTTNGLLLLNLERLLSANRLIVA